MTSVTPAQVEALDRLMSYVSPEPNSGCWLWTGSTASAGYGSFYFDGKTMRAHRFSYEYFNGHIPNDVPLDHKCRIRSCVNPKHLEVVSTRENIMRSPISLTAINFRKTHCVNGHKFSETNTRHIHYPKVRIRGRVCRECVKSRQKKYRRRRRDKKDATIYGKTEMIGGVSREMTLTEWCARLPQSHTVNLELSALRKQLREELT